MALSNDTKREVNKVMFKEIQINSESIISEILSIRSELCLCFPNDRDKIITAFSDLLFNARELGEKINRYERRV